MSRKDNNMKTIIATALVIATTATTAFANNYSWSYNNTQSRGIETLAGELGIQDHIWTNDITSARSVIRDLLESKVAEGAASRQAEINTLIGERNTATDQRQSLLNGLTDEAGLSRGDVINAFQNGQVAVGNVVTAWKDAEVSAAEAAKDIEIAAQVAQTARVQGNLDQRTSQLGNVVDVAHSLGIDTFDFYSASSNAQNYIRAAITAYGDSRAALVDITADNAAAIDAAKDRANTWGKLGVYAGQGIVDGRSYFDVANVEILVGATLEAQAESAYRNGYSDGYNDGFQAGFEAGVNSVN